MKQTLLIITMLFAAMAAMAQAPALTVNGEIADRVPASLSFDGDMVVVQFADGTTSTYDMADITIDYTVDALGDVVVFTFKGTIGKIITVTGADDSQPVQLFDASGRLISSTKAVNGEAAIDASSLTRGVYLLKNGKNLVKLVK